MTILNFDLKSTDIMFTCEQLHEINQLFLKAKVFLEREDVAGENEDALLMKEFPSMVTASALDQSMKDTLKSSCALNGVSETYCGLAIISLHHPMGQSLEEVAKLFVDQYMANPYQKGQPLIGDVLETLPRLLQAMKYVIFNK